MTRDEAKEIFWNDTVVCMRCLEMREEMNGFIDTIFDDFESRTCENCVHWNVSTESEMDGNGDGFIDCMIVYAESFGSITYKDFGCNKFERKDK